MSNTSFHQQTKSINSQHFTANALKNHKFLISHIHASSAILHKNTNAPKEPAREHTPGRTSPFILKQALAPLHTKKPMPISQLHHQLSKARRILDATGIFKEVCIELEDNDLLNKQDVSEYGNHQHLYSMNAKLLAMEKQSRNKASLGASINNNGQSEVTFSWDFRNLFHMADVLSLSASGTNSSFNELFFNNGREMSFSERLTTPQLMWSVGWRVPFIFGNFTNVELKSGTSPVNDNCSVNQVSRGFEVSSEFGGMDPSEGTHQLSFRQMHRKMLLGGHYQKSLSLLEHEESDESPSLSNKLGAIVYHYHKHSIDRDAIGSAESGWSFRVNTLIGSKLFGGSSNIFRTETESNYYIPLFKGILGGLTFKSGVAVPLDVLNGDSKHGLYLGDRVFAKVRGFNHVGKLAYIEEIQDGNSSNGSYQSKGGNLALSATARVIVPFHAIPKLNILNFIYAQGFINAGNTVPYDFRSRFNHEDFAKGMHVSYGGGIFIPLGGARIELNYAIPLRQPDYGVGTNQNFQKFQLSFQFEW